MVSIKAMSPYALAHRSALVLRKNLDKLNGKVGLNFDSNVIKGILMLHEEQQIGRAERLLDPSIPRRRKVHGENIFDMIFFLFSDGGGNWKAKRVDPLKTLREFAQQLQANNLRAEMTSKLHVFGGDFQLKLTDRLGHSYERDIDSRLNIRQLGRMIKKATKTFEATSPTLELKPLHS